jgi:hypothetical protein
MYKLIFDKEVEKFLKNRIPRFAEESGMPYWNLQKTLIAQLM